MTPTKEDLAAAREHVDNLDYKRIVRVGYNQCIEEGFLAGCAFKEAECARLRTALEKVKDGIIDSHVDTVWVSKYQTALDCIDEALAPKEQSGEAEG